MDPSQTVRYVGRSMNPFLIQNDVLYWIPVFSRTIQKGDIVIFRALCNDQLIIHRVIRILPDDRYITKGDNNRTADKNPIHIDQIVGIITGGVRGNTPLRVNGGRRGSIVHMIAQTRMRVLPVLHTVLFPVYYFISDTGIFSRLFSPLFLQRLVVVKTPDGHDLQVYYGHHLAGWKAEQDRGWTIRPPYRIFLNTKILPESVSDLMMDE